MKYNHTQRGNLMIFIFVATSLLFGFIFMQADFESILLAIIIPVLFVISSFVSLNVIVDETYLRIKFSYGVVKKRFLLNEIISVKTVRNHWYYGWGIRRWLWPRMIIFNVSGFDAVEIKMKNEKVYRIGTDDPQGLEFAIKQKLSKLMNIYDI